MRFLTMGVATASFLLGLVGPSASASPSRILYVSAQAGARGRGTRARPYKSLKRALAVARNGGTVRVTRGSYEGDLVIKKRTLTMIGAYVDKRFDRRDIAKARSVIQGTGRDAVVSLIRAGKTRIDGFVITGGGGSTRDDAKASHGGGVYVQGGAPTIAHCLIEKNRTTRKGSDTEEAGGGVFAREGGLTLEDSVIRANISKRGAGIALLDMKRATIRRNVIEDNIAVGDHGGGVYAICRNLVMAENLVRRNEVGRKIGYGWGGGVATISKGTRVRLSKNIVTGNFAASLGSGYFIDDESDVVIDQDLIVGNHCAPEGGTAIFVDGLDPEKGSRARIVGTTIVNHPCAGVAKGNAVHADQHSSVTILQSVIWNNGKRALSTGKRSTITVARSIIRDKRFSGEGVVHDTPRFVAPKKGDFRLRGAVVGGAKMGVTWKIAGRVPGGGGNVAGAAGAKPATPRRGETPDERVRDLPVGKSGSWSLSGKKTKAPKDDCNLGHGGEPGGEGLALIWGALVLGWLWRWRRG